MIEPEMKRDSQKSLHVDQDLLKSSSTVKITQGVGVNRKPIARINLMEPKIDSKCKDLRVNKHMQEYQNEQSKVFGTEVNSKLVANSPSPSVHSPASGSPTHNSIRN